MQKDVFERDEKGLQFSTGMENNRPELDEISQVPTGGHIVG